MMMEWTGFGIIQSSYDPFEEILITSQAQK